jgi:hypothetical protein
VNTGTPTGEGKNEFLAFNTGSAALSLTGFSVGYGTTTSATDFTINGATVSWLSLPVSPVISNSAGTITNITSGSIPANTNVVILNAGYAVPYDLATFGTNVYVLVYNTGTGVSGFTTAGNFANKSSPSGLRYFRITAGACNNLVSYDKNAAAFAVADGAGAKWDAAGSITFASTGGSGAVLPLGLLDFSLRAQSGFARLRWRTPAQSNFAAFVVQKSIDGLVYRSIGELQSYEAESGKQSEYEFSDDAVPPGGAFYRLQMKDMLGTVVYTEALRVSSSTRANGVSVYPNPAKDRVFIASEIPVQQVRLCNSLGQLCLVTDSSEPVIAHLPSGLYLLHIQTTDGQSHSLSLMKE